MKIILFSDVDRDQLFAEIYEGGKQWAEVWYDESQDIFKTRIFIQMSKEHTGFDLSEVQKALEDAKFALKDP